MFDLVALYNLLSNYSAYLKFSLLGGYIYIRVVYFIRLVYNFNGLWKLNIIVCSILRGPPKTVEIPLFPFPLSYKLLNFVENPRPYPARRTCTIQHANYGMSNQSETSINTASRQTLGPARGAGMCCFNGLSARPKAPVPASCHIRKLANVIIVLCLEDPVRSPVHRYEG